MAKTRLLTGILLVTILIATMLAGCTPQPGPTPPAPVPSPAPVPVPEPAPAPAPAPSPVPSGTLNIYVTDAPPHQEVTGILVTLSEVQVHKAVAEQEQEEQQGSSDNQTPEKEQEQQQIQQGEGEWITIDINDNAATFDLLQIKDIEQFIGSNEVEAGKYTQIRLVIDTVKVALDGGEPQDAEVPSNELKIVRPFDIIAGETTALTLDFEADKMVTVTGSDKIIVRPVIKLSVRQEERKQPNE